MEKVTDKELSGFTGTENYYVYKILNTKLLLTDGVKYVADRCQAYWLIDIILSYQLESSLIKEGFQVWRLLKDQKGDGATVTCDDGNDNLIIQQQIEYSDFPLATIRFFVVDGVCMLPREY